MCRQTSDIRRFVGILLVAALATLGRSQTSFATDLIFESDSGSTLGIAAFDGSGTNYGHRVTGSPQDGYNYGPAGGPTPNVIAAYGTNANGSTFSGWSGGYGDLTNVAFGSPDTNGDGIWEMALIADAGYHVQLLSFDLAGWLFTDYTATSVSVLDGSDNPLFFQANALIEGDGSGPQHTSFSFGPLEASVLKIRVQSDDGFATNIGIDNVVFAQVVPEPASIGLLAAGSLVLLPLVRRRKKA